MQYLIKNRWWAYLSKAEVSPSAEMRKGNISVNSFVLPFFPAVIFYLFSAALLLPNRQLCAIIDKNIGNNARKAVRRSLCGIAYTKLATGEII